MSNSMYLENKFNNFIHNSEQKITNERREFESAYKECTREIKAKQIIVVHSFLKIHSIRF